MLTRRLVRAATRINGTHLVLSASASNAWLSKCRSTRPSPSAPRRYFATPPPQDRVSELSMTDYHAVADHTMEYLLEQLEELVERTGDPSHEVEYSSGVLTLNLGRHGIYVINKQPPNKQIWLSSPHSGPKRYDLSMDARDWVYLRDGRSLGQLLDEELRQSFGDDGLALELGPEVQRTVTEHFDLPPQDGSSS